MEIRVKYLPFIAISVLVLTIVVTSCLSEILGHVEETFPYISDTGTKTPESCIFGQALNILWVLVSFVIYIKYRQVKDILNRYNMGNKKILNRTTMQIGLGAAAGISIVANFQKTDKNLFYVHWCGIVITLGLGAAYQCMQTVLYTNLVKIIGQRKITLLRMVLSVISVLTFLIFLIFAIVAYKQKKDENYLQWPEGDDVSVFHTVSAVFEWICTSSTALYLALFCWEFKKITLYEPDVFVEDRVTLDLDMGRTNKGFQDV